MNEFYCPSPHPPSVTIWCSAHPPTPAFDDLPAPTLNGWIKASIYIQQPRSFGLIAMLYSESRLSFTQSH